MHPIPACSGCTSLAGLRGEPSPRSTTSSPAPGGAAFGLLRSPHPARERDDLPLRTLGRRRGDLASVNLGCVTCLYVDFLWSRVGKALPALSQVRALLPSLCLRVVFLPLAPMGETSQHHFTTPQRSPSGRGNPAGHQPRSAGPFQAQRSRVELPPRTQVGGSQDA